MPVSKLKSIAILILLLANLALLALVVPNRMEERQEEETLRQSLRELCAQQEVELDPAIVPDTVALYALELAEDSGAALKAATALLGAEVLVQDDSTRYLSTYRSGAGTCSISRSGGLTAELTGGEARESLEEDAERLLGEMGFQISRHGSAMLRSDGSRTVSAMQSILGVTVFSQGLTLTYRDSRLIGVEGVFFTGDVTRVDSSTCISAADALVAFLSARFDLGWVGSAVTAMEQGYRQADTASAAIVHLSPVWKIDTDTGSFYVDGLTGAVTGQ